MIWKGTTPYVIAEAGVNHNGDMVLAKQLIKAAVEAGADAVKFQSFVVDELVTADVAMADYQKRNLGVDGNQYQMLMQLALSFEQQAELFEYATKLGITWISSPFDLKSLAYLVDELKVSFLKIPSGELTNGPLLLAAARSGLPLVISTGMANLGDVEKALEVICFGLLHPEGEPDPDSLLQAYSDKHVESLLADRLCLLHCTTEYPAPYETLNLRAMEQLGRNFGVAVGYSDHSEGIHIPVAAAAMGAKVIEKHFTLDRTLAGPDHSASIEPDELSAMVRQIRQAAMAVGNGIKRPMGQERDTASVARRRLVALQPIKSGELFSSENMGVRRHVKGISGIAYWHLLGKAATRDFAVGEGIDFGLLTNDLF